MNSNNGSVPYTESFSASRERAAVNAAEMGWYVFPCKPHTKIPATKHGFKDASISQPQIEAWFRSVDTNIGLACGMSGLVVVDFDSSKPEYAGQELLDLLEEHYPTVEQYTPSKGTHMLYAQRPGLKLTNKSSNMPKGVDIRGEGGYILLAPSDVTYTGNDAIERGMPDGFNGSYIWRPGFSPNDIEVAVIPAFLVDMIMGPPAKREQTPSQKNARSGDGTKDSVIAEFNRTHSIIDILVANGYAFVKSTANIARLARPGRETESVTVFRDQKPERSYHHSTSDPLKTDEHARDAFDVWTSLEHGGDMRKAFEAAKREQGTWVEKMVVSPPVKVEEAMGSGPMETPAPTGPSTASNNGSTPPPKPVSAAADSAARFCTDLGNGRRFVEQHMDDVRFVSSWGWLVWDGKRWQRDEGGAVVRMGKETVLSILDEAKDAMLRAQQAIENLKGIEDKNEQEKLEELRDKHMKRARELTAWAMKSQGDSRLRAMLSLAESEIEVVARAEEFDIDMHLLNCQNGTLDLRTGRLYPHDRRDKLTRLAPVEYNPNAKCQRFEQFIDEVFMGDKELVQYMQRALGYGLTGNTEAHCFFFCHGNGSNGKSTLFETFRHVLGGDYWMKMTSETLMAKQNSGIPNDVAKLQGARMVVASEIEEGSRWAEGKLKDLTGGDTLPARFLHQEFFDFKPAFKLWIFGNSKPIVRGTDNGIWRRMRLVPFNACFKGKEDPKLPEKLAAEAEGILAWAVRGCLDWQEHGLGNAGAVEASTMEYRADMDLVGKFVEECCIMLPAARTKTKDLYAAYTKWCAEQGVPARSQTAFGTQIGERPGLKKYGGAARGFEGIGLLDTSTRSDGED